MSTRLKLSVVVCSALCLISICVGYELTLDNENDIRPWKFDGVYLHAKFFEDIAVLSPDLEKVLSKIEAPGNNSSPRIGYWFTKHSSEGDSHFNLQCRLRHHLFFQVWITFLASPSVPVIIKCNGKEAIRFWSNGKAWCDGITNVFGSQIVIEATTPDTSDWIVLDRAVLGIMSNISTLDERQFNPCLTSPQSIIPSHDSNDSDKIPDVGGKRAFENQGGTVGDTYAQPKNND